MTDKITLHPSTPLNLKEFLERLLDLVEQGEFSTVSKGAFIIYEPDGSSVVSPFGTEDPNQITGILFKAAMTVVLGEI